MDIYQLEAFLTVYRTRNFTKSSEILHVAQSTVTARIKTLEDYVGKELFIRTNKNVELTPAGEVFLNFAERMVSLSHESKEAVSLEGQFEGRLVLGGPASAWNNLYDEHLKQWKENHPNIAIDLMTHSTELTIQKVADGIIHVGIVYSKPRHPSLQTHLLREDEMILVGKERGIEPVTIHDLYRKNFVLNQWGSSFTEWLDSTVGERFIPAFRINQTTIILKMFLMDDSFGFIPKSIAQKYIDQKQLFELAYDFPRPLPKHNIYAITLRSNENNRYAKMGLAILKGDPSSDGN